MQQIKGILMTIRKIFMLTCVSLFSLMTSINGHAEESFGQEEMTENYLEKTYLSSERIFIHAEGIFFMNDMGNVVPARFIGSDASGLFVCAAMYQCPGCRRWNSDNVCGNSRCSLYGR